MPPLTRKLARKQNFACSVVDHCTPSYILLYPPKNVQLKVKYKLLLYNFQGGRNFIWDMSFLRPLAKKINHSNFFSNIFPDVRIAPLLHFSVLRQLCSAASRRLS